jgi:hypothetical protein
MLSFFTLWTKVKASQMKNDKLANIDQLAFIYLRGFDFVQRVKKLNIVGLMVAKTSNRSLLDYEDPNSSSKMNIII